MPKRTSTPTELTLKPIETIYNGYRFRSRLEARWAIFFDMLDIEWEYEKEGYELEGIRYLPDFWLPKYKEWVEIKGQQPTQTELEKARRLALASNCPVLIFAGNIGIISAKVFWPWNDTKTDQIIAAARWFWAECPICHHIGLVSLDYLSKACSCLDGIYASLDTCWEASEDKTYYHWLLDQINCLTAATRETPRLLAAYAAAKQARFEFGE